MFSSIKNKVKGILSSVKEYWTKNKHRVLLIAVLVMLLVTAVLLIVSRVKANKEYTVNDVVVITTPDKYYEQLNEDFNELKDGNVELVRKYFGTSDIYTSNEVADKMIWTSMSFVYKTIEDKNETILVHICSFDYNKLNDDFLKAKEEKLKDKATEEDAKSYAQRVITRNLIDNKYKVCYNISLRVIDKEVEITEAYKQAITGNWYSCGLVELEQVDCICN